MVKDMYSSESTSTWCSSIYAPGQEVGKCVCGWVNQSLGVGVEVSEDTENV